MNKVGGEVTSAQIISFDKCMSNARAKKPLERFKTRRH